MPQAGTGRELGTECFGRHVTLAYCPRGVRQALQLIGAEAVPSLVLRDRVGGV
ncbi:hypothetical protein [Dactylosporangium sp. NPDC048998]|uniref:hypothetical protein n=1 Tax=Dactylosporangium sp. NPDC048998 TaxID=3363976 RepID=UPI00371A6F2D